MPPETQTLLRRAPKPAFFSDSVIEAGGRWLSHLGRPVRDILIVNGHPDPAPERFCAALCEAYELGARSRRRVTQRLNAGAIGSMDEALEQIRWAGMLVLVYPLWLDRMPAALNELIAKAAEAGLLRREGDARHGLPDLRTVVTMDMPAFAHRDLCRKPGRTALTCNGDALAGLATELPTYIGCVDRLTEERRLEWLDKIRALGASDV